MLLRANNLSMKYILKKILTMLITLFLVTMFVYLAFNLISGDPAVSILGTEATPERLEALRQEMGLNDPILVRYFRWLGDFLTGDMGTSYSYKLSVSSMIGEKIPVTLMLGAYSFALMLIISIPLGIYTSKHAGSAADRVIYVINQIIMAIPAFFSGILITFIFGRLLKIFTPGGYVSYKNSIGGFLGYMFFPALSIALAKSTMAVKLLRTSILKEADADYVRTAYSKGLSTTKVLYRHVLKNAILPTITFFGMCLSDMIAGSIVIEQVFSVPGLGRILLTSISNRDYPVVMAIIVIIAMTVLVVNMLVDIIYSIVDPRISLE